MCCTRNAIFAQLMHLMHCINFVMASAFSAGASMQKGSYYWLPPLSVWEVIHSDDGSDGLAPQQTCTAVATAPRGLDGLLLLSPSLSLTLLQDRAGIAVCERGSGPHPPFPLTPHSHTQVNFANPPIFFCTEYRSKQSINIYGITY